MTADASRFKMMIAAVICVSLICGILPKEGAGKYAGFAAGLVVVAVIISSFCKLSDEQKLPLADLSIETLTFRGETYLTEEFEKTLAERIAEKLKTETGFTFDVAVLAEVKQDANAIHTTSVEIAPYSAQYARLVADYIGIAQDRVVEKR